MRNVNSSSLFSWEQGMVIDQAPLSGRHMRSGGAWGPAGAHTYDKPQNPTENFRYSGSTAAVLYLSLPLKDEEEDYDETHNGDYMHVFSRGDES